MRPNSASAHLHRRWWWVFSLLIVAPALALALLEADPNNPSYIVGVRGVGYRFDRDLSGS